jgi:hypothetical protein
MRILFFFIIPVSIFIACKKRDNTPKDILPVAKMKELLRDMMQADIFVNDYVISRNPALNKDSARIASYSEVFAIHKISKETFQKSFAYYKTHPLQLKTVMDSISIATAPTQIVSPIDVSDTVQTAEKPIKPTIQADSALQKPLKRKALQKLKY